LQEINAIDLVEVPGRYQDITVAVEVIPDTAAVPEVAAPIDVLGRQQEVPARTADRGEHINVPQGRRPEAVIMEAVQAQGQEVVVIALLLQEALEVREAIEAPGHLPEAPAV